MNTLILKTLQQAKRLIVIVVGSTVLLIGIAMIVLPGPAVLVIPVGLSVLATELVWARDCEQTQKYISKRKGKKPCP
jgi:hypothetical protein